MASSLRFKRHVRYRHECISQRQNSGLSFDLHYQSSNLQICKTGHFEKSKDFHANSKPGGCTSHNSLLQKTFNSFSQLYCSAKGHPLLLLTEEYPLSPCFWRKPTLALKLISKLCGQPWMHKLFSKVAVKIWKDVLLKDHWSFIWPLAYAGGFTAF